MLIEYRCQDIISKWTFNFSPATTEREHVTELFILLTDWYDPEWIGSICIENSMLKLNAHNLSYFVGIFMVMRIEVYKKLLILWCKILMRTSTLHRSTHSILPQSWKIPIAFFFPKIRINEWQHLLYFYSAVERYGRRRWI